MKVALSDFNPNTFSFHKDPVLVIEDFWTPSERKLFLKAMGQTSWRSLKDMPSVLAAFPDCGNWQKAHIAQAEAGRFLNRLALHCIQDYMESFPNITGRRMSFNYYSYGAGDCLLTHDDTAQDGAASDTVSPVSALRRLALITYVHDEWRADWGGELMIYTAKPDPNSDRPRLSISHCIAPEPGSLVLFTVPRFHRVCRVDPLIGDHKRLSIAGWLMTEHASAR